MKKRAARRLALHYGCSTSEAIRRAILRHQELVFGIPAEIRQARNRNLLCLVELFKWHDGKDEIESLKRQDEGF